MKLIICVDDHFGYAFNNRKQSSDRVLTSHLQKFMKEIGDEYLTDDISEGGWCFVKTCDLPEDFSTVDEILLYHWNRSYPYDKQFPKELLSDYDLVFSKEFAGSSHDCILFEHFLRAYNNE